MLRAAQTQLIRLGCLTGKVDGTLNATTKTALGRYLSIEGQPTENASVTEGLVAELTKHATRVCPIECRSGETLKGETCVADEKPKAPPAVASRPKDNEDDARSRRKQGGRQADRERAQSRRRKRRARASRPWPGRASSVAAAAAAAVR